MLKKVILSVSLLSLMSPVFAEWVSGSVKVYAPSPSDAPMGVFFNSYTGAGAAVNTWTTVDLSDVVPDNTIAVYLTGILIITHGTKQETADMHMFFRQDQSYDPKGRYTHQVIEASSRNGQRSTMGVWVALDANKRFQYKWETGPESIYGQYPAYSAYGANLLVNAVLTR